MVIVVNILVIEVIELLKQSILYFMYCQTSKLVCKWCKGNTRHDKKQIFFILNLITL